MLCGCLPFAARAAGNLDFYFMDVESGGATLLVSPSGRAVLIDGGNKTPDNRDTGRFWLWRKR